MLLGLDRVHDALDALGRPQDDLRVVHVTGSNGKGSVSAMVESIARAAGLRTGLYTSPHLCRFAERIRVDGAPIDDALFSRALGAVLDRCRPDLTFFESLTLAAFHAFRDAEVDLAVLEVGLGGRLDATNVVREPLVTAITTITLEHTEILGDTLEHIAREKAGIFKPGSPVVLGPLEPEADREVARIAGAVGAGPIRRARGAEVRGMSIGLPGPHQLDNAAVAAAIASFLERRWPAIGAAVKPGLLQVEWPGRFERITRGDVTVVLDCAHNPQGAAALAATLHDEAIDPAQTSLVFGALGDKDWGGMLAALLPRVSRRYYATPKGRKAAALEELQRLGRGEAVGDPIAAVEQAISESKAGDTVVVTGSIYLVGEVRAHLLGIEADPVIAL